MTLVSTPGFCHHFDETETQGNDVRRTSRKYLGLLSRVRLVDSRFTFQSTLLLLSDWDLVVRDKLRCFIRRRFPRRCSELENDFLLTRRAPLSIRSRMYYRRTDADGLLWALRALLRSVQYYVQHLPPIFFHHSSTVSATPKSHCWSACAGDIPMEITALKRICERPSVCKKTIPTSVA